MGGTACRRTRHAHAHAPTIGPTEPNQPTAGLAAVLLIAGAGWYGWKYRYGGRGGHGEEESGSYFGHKYALESGVSSIVGPWCVCCYAGTVIGMAQVRAGERGEFHDRALECIYIYIFIYTRVL